MFIHAVQILHPKDQIDVLILPPALSLAAAWITCLEMDRGSSQSKAGLESFVPEVDLEHQLLAVKMDRPTKVGNDEQRTHAVDGLWKQRFHEETLMPRPCGRDNKVVHNAVALLLSRSERATLLRETSHTRRSGWEKIMSTMGIGVRRAGSVLAKAGPRRAF